MKHLKRFAGAAVSLTSFLFARHSFADFAPAEQLSAREEAVLGIDTESLTRMESTADGYKRRGLYSHAETIIQEVFDMRQKKKGADDPEMAYYHNNLGWLKPSKANTPKRNNTICARARSRRRRGGRIIPISPIS